MAPPSNRRLILVRHAHRDKSRGRQVDNGLSDKGRLQAEAFAGHWLPLLQGKRAAFLSSPKRRCRETVAPLADVLGGTVRVSLLLDEQREVPPEPSRRFRARIKRFLAWWRVHGPEITVACSHGDWIPECLAQAVGREEDVVKGGWVELELTDNRVRRRKPD